jgi:hypothetical protein
LDAAARHSGFELVSPFLIVGHPRQVPACPQGASDEALEIRREQDTAAMKRSQLRIPFGVGQVRASWKRNR